MVWIIRQIAIDTVVMKNDHIEIKYFLNKKLKYIKYSDIIKLFSIRKVDASQNTYVMQYKLKGKKMAFRFICGSKEFKQDLEPLLSNKNIFISERWEKHYRA